MKNKKYISCSGLAFGDCEDMEMLHIYALHGWIFRDFKMMCYVLYKEEPQDLVFSYDMQKVKKQDKADYLMIFQEAGWQEVVSKDEIHFFYAPKGTPELHTDQKTRNQQYHMPFWVGVAILLAGVALLGVGLLTTSSYTVELGGLGGGLIGGGAVLCVGSYARMKGKRIRADFGKKRANIILILIGLFCIGSFLWMFYKQGATDGWFGNILFIAISLWLIGTGSFGLRRSRVYQQWLAEANSFQEERKHD